MIQSPPAIELPLPKKYSSIANVPPITEQTPWRCDYFDFGKAKVDGVDYFNCGLVERPDATWLVTRRSKNVKWSKIGFNDIMCFKLQDTMPTWGIKSALNPMHPDVEHFEDPRALYHDGKTYLTCCNFVMKMRQWTGAHQIVCEVDENWSLIKRYDPVYGYNGRELGMNTGHEKNWIWFFHDGLPHLVYWTNPHQVAVFDKDFVAVVAHETKPELNWHFGEPRGGTPPVRIGDEYWSFFHSSTVWKAPKRQYHMGVYTFEAKAPFRITRMTELPILSGSKFDPWHGNKPLVVFPCGAVLRNGKWLVTLGVNDLISAWLEIPHDELETLLVDINK